MMYKFDDEIEIQRRYYADTANKYNLMHVHEKDEHFFALCFLISVLDYYEIKSILDIGSGTGRALLYIKQKRADIRITGIEPVSDLRKIGYSHGLNDHELVDGDATRLQFQDCEFDMVCEFGVLHHVRNPETVVSEMLRVAKKVIFISDSNNFGQGPMLMRAIKQLINFFGLWKLINFIKTKGKGYGFSEDEGVAYSYSVFNNYKQIRGKCELIHLLNTRDGLINPYKTASHVALLGVIKQ